MAAPRTYGCGALEVVGLLVLPLLLVSGRCNGAMGRRGWVWWAVGIVLLLGAFAVLYGWLPWWIDRARLRGLSAKDQAGVLGGDRGDVLKMVAGAGALVALVYTARKHALDREGQVTDRYSKAITQLASEKPSERIGGIYALERIMADSPRDQPTVVEVLAAFVRQRALRTIGSSTQSGEGGSEATQRTRPDSDVQAAMTVLARRPARKEPFALDLRRTVLAGLELPARARLDGANLADADLTGANLRKAWLTEANLVDADLTGAYLNEATLIDSNLTRATLSEAKLTDALLIGATLNEATLTGATLYKATLTGAILIGATLNEAMLTWAHLYGAHLNGATLTGATLNGATLTGATLGGAILIEANLRGVQGLVASQLADALVDSSTLLHKGLARDAWVRARIQACKGWSSDMPVPSATPDPSKGAA